MRHISNSGLPTAEAIAREKARRQFNQADDVAAEVERFRVNVADRHLTELVARATSDPVRAEASKRAVVAAADELAGPDASLIVKQLCLAVAILDVEVHLAGVFHLRAVASGARSADFLRWQMAADRRLNAKLRTLAFIRSVEMSSIRSTLDRLRLVG